MWTAEFNAAVSGESGIWCSPCIRLIMKSNYNSTQVCFSAMDDAGSPFSGLMLQLPASFMLCSLLSTHALAVTPGDNWKDSYSVDDQCYCTSTFDHGAGELIVETPAGARTVEEICDAIGPGPGEGNNPLYNDIQCGNGPANNSPDETECPGRVDMGAGGCSIIGPTWNLEEWFSSPEQPSSGDTDDSSEATVGDSTSEGTATEPDAGQNTTDGTSATGDASPTAGPPPAGLRIEAESFDAADDRWQLVMANAVTSADLQYDHDPLHLNGAEGSAYLEVLPDLRVLPADPVNADSLWTIAQEGPALQYEIDFPVAGQYQVFVRGYSTGPHDDTIHVGIDGSWPVANSFLDLCDQRDQWVWSNCHDVEEPVIQVATAGVHTVYFTARDDGFEFDSFVLALLDSSTTLVQNSTDEPDIGKAIQVGGGVVPGVGSVAVWFSGIALIAFFLRLARRTLLV